MKKLIVFIALFSLIAIAPAFAATLISTVSLNTLMVHQ